MKQAITWLDRNALWGLSIIIMIASNGGDGRYIRGWQITGVVGFILGYGLNLAVDAVQEILAFEFTRHWMDTQQGAARARKRLLSLLLLAGQFGLIYFAVVFAYRQFSLLRPTEPEWLRWSMAAFAPAALMLLGVAQALRTQQQGERKPRKIKPQFPCLAPGCDYVAKNQQALSAHSRIHKRDNGREPVVVEPTPLNVHHKKER